LRYFSWKHNHMSQYVYFGKPQQDLKTDVHYNMQQ
jgi:hypothetical protein